MLLFISSLFISFFTTMLLVKFAHIHDRFSGDHDLTGVQKFHTRAVPRIGGLAIILSFGASGLILWQRSLAHTMDFYLILAVAIPAFLCGVHEDIYKQGGVFWRFTIVIASSVLAWSIANIQITRIDIFFIDRIFQYPAFSLLFTIVSIAGMTNAMNLIDGYNGLASAVAGIMLVGIAYVSLLTSDFLILSISIALAGAVLGFFVWNWPRGLIFLGDGGAYFLGFMVAILVILLVGRNPSVSPWFAALLVSYPTMETIFTMCRRLARRKHLGLPDAAHLHQLIYMRMMHWVSGNTAQDQLLKRNSMTSPYLWAMSSLGVIPAVLFWNNSLALKFAAFAFAVIYLWIYHAVLSPPSPK